MGSVGNFTGIADSTFFNSSSVGGTQPPLGADGSRSPVAPHKKEAVKQPNTKKGWFGLMNILFPNGWAYSIRPR